MRGADSFVRLGAAFADRPQRLAGRLFGFLAEKRFAEAPELDEAEKRLKNQGSVIPTSE